MGVRVALLLTVLIHADIACGQSTAIYEASGRGFWPHRVKFTPDGRYVLMVGVRKGDAAGDQPEFRVWDVHAGEFIAEHRFDSYTGIQTLDVAPDGETLLVSVSGPGRRSSYNGHKVWVGDQEVWLWRWEARPVRPRSSRVRSVLAPIRRIMSVQCANPAPGARLDKVLFSPAADLIAAHRNETRPLGDWPQIRHFDEVDILEPSGQLQTTIVPPDPVSEHTRGRTHGMAFSPDGQRLATTTLSDDVPHELGLVVRVDLRLWDVQSGEELAQRSVVDSAVSRRSDLATGGGNVLAFSLDGSLIASDGVDHTIQLWDADMLEPVRRLGEVRQDRLQSLAFSPDSRLLIATAALRRNRGFESQLLLWEVATGEVLLRMDEDLADIYTVEFSPDGGWLLTLGGIAPDVPGSAVRLWDVNQLLAIGAGAEPAGELR